MIGLGFTAPWLLAAAAALAIPVLAHLARHEDRAGQGFPSLMFLRRVPFPARARHRLEDRVLLALRALALLLLVLAFAGPYPRHADGAAATQSDTVVLLDLSYSMGLGDRFERAREAAADALAAGGADARVALLGFDSVPRLLSALGDGRIAAQAALASAQPGVHGTDIARALDGAWRLLASSPAPRRRVLLISDLQAAGVGADPRLPDGVELEVRAVQGAAGANLAILGAWRAGGAAGSDARALLRVRVANTGGEAGAATLHLVVDDLPAAQQELQLAPGQARDLALALFPAAQRATRVHLYLDPPDALPADDAHFAVLAPPRALDVLLVRDRAGDDPYLEAALALSRDPVLRTTVVAASALSVQQVEAADAIVLDGVSGLDGALARALDARVAAGAGLLAFAGDGALAPSPIARAAPIVPASLPASGAVVAAGVPGTGFGALAHTHPIARGLGDARVEGVKVWRHRAPQPGAGDVVLARLADGTAAVVERTHGTGRSLAFATSPARGWSDLALDPVFVPLLIETLRYLTGTVSALPQHAPGSVLDPAAHAAAVEPDGALARALEQQRALWLRAPGGVAQRVRGEQPLRLDAPGFHELRADGGALLPVAVSVVTAESALELLDASSFAERVRRYPHPAPPRDAAAAAGDDDDDALARVLLVLALCLLFAEGLYAARVTRRRASEAVA